jgi:hypothetical protein
MVIGFEVNMKFKIQLIYIRLTFLLLSKYFNSNCSVENIFRFEYVSFLFNNCNLKVKTV